MRRAGIWIWTRVGYGLVWGNGSAEGDMGRGADGLWIGRGQSLEREMDRGRISRI